MVQVWTALVLRVVWLSQFVVIRYLMFILFLSCPGDPLGWIRLVVCSPMALIGKEESDVVREKVINILHISYM